VEDNKNPQKERWERQVAAQAEYQRQVLSRTNPGKTFQRSARVEAAKKRSAAFLASIPKKPDTDK
jgi:hypothetical protein